MKSLMLAVSIGLVGAVPARACDICGCGVSNYNPYLFPHLSKRYVSFTYMHRVYTTRPEDAPESRERYNTWLLSGQYSIGKRFQVLALVPWQVNSLNSSVAHKSVSGLGDITLLGQIRVWDHLTKRVRHTIMAGAGVKLATGRYTPATSGKADDQNFQLGTGSTDLLFNASYRLSLRKWIFGVTGSYKYNNANSDGFRFGDVANVGVLAVYRKEFEEYSIAPYVQLSHEQQLKDADRHLLQGHSGGTVFYAGGGIDLNTRKFTVGVNYRFAADQSLAAGQIHVGLGISAHASFSF